MTYQTEESDYFSSNKNQKITHFYSRIYFYFIICFLADLIIFALISMPDLVNSMAGYIIFYEIALIVIYQYFFKGKITNWSYQRRLLYLLVPTIHFIIISAIALIFINDLLNNNAYLAILVLSFIAGAIHIHIRTSRYFGIPLLKAY